MMQKIIYEVGSMQRIVVVSAYRQSKSVRGAVDHLESVRPTTVSHAARLGDGGEAGLVQK